MNKGVKLAILDGYTIVSLFIGVIAVKHLSEGVLLGVGCTFGCRF